MIITGSMTLVVGVCFWVWFPDNPMTAHFLSEEEKIIAIERLRNQSTGIENKTWKAEQFWEAMTDWKPWAVGVSKSGLECVAEPMSVLRILCPRQCFELLDEHDPAHHWSVETKYTPMLS